MIYLVDVVEWHWESEASLLVRFKLWVFMASSVGGFILFYWAISEFWEVVASIVPFLGKASAGVLVF